MNQSYSLSSSIAKNLRIEIGLLPRRTPDGKAIVERVIRELKSRNGSASIEGAYQRRPTDYETRKAVKTAKAAAAYNLDVYKRQIIRSTVDLPEPFKPSKPILAPGKNDKEISLMIVLLGGTILLTRSIDITY